METQITGGGSYVISDEADEFPLFFFTKSFHGSPFSCSGDHNHDRKGSEI